MSEQWSNSSVVNTYCTGSQQCFTALLNDTDMPRLNTSDARPRLSCNTVRWHCQCIIGFTGDVCNIATTATYFEAAMIVVAAFMGYNYCIYVAKYMMSLIAADQRLNAKPRKWFLAIVLQAVILNSTTFCVVRFSATITGTTLFTVWVESFLQPIGQVLVMLCLVLISSEWIRSALMMQPKSKCRRNLILLENSLHISIWLVIVTHLWAIAVSNVAPAVFAAQGAVTLLLTLTSCAVFIGYRQLQHLSTTSSNNPQRIKLIQAVLKSTSSVVQATALFLFVFVAILGFVIQGSLPSVFLFLSTYILVDGCIKYLVASKVNAPVLQLSGLRRKVSGKVFRFKDGVTGLRRKDSLQKGAATEPKAVNMENLRDFQSCKESDPCSSVLGVPLEYDTDGKVAPKPVEGKEQDAGTLTEGL